MYKIISIGKIKNKNLLNEIENLKNRISRIEFLELKEVKDKNPEIIKEKEFNLIEKHLSSNNFNILLTENGKEFNTYDFYNFIKKKELEKDIIFIISGPYGPSEKLLNHKLIDLYLSLSKMVFTHEQAKYLLLEQIYRIECFKKNIPYTK